MKTPGLVLLFVAGTALGGPSPQGGMADTTVQRMSVSAGMGVSYIHATGIVDRINGSGITVERAGDFVAGAEFFGAVAYPINRDWIVKLEYAYLIASYNIQTLYPGSEFTIHTHMPTLVAQYVLIDRGVYSVKGGVGLGYHFGEYTERYGTVDATFTGSGPAAKLDLEANTAFGESFYAYLGGDIRFDFIGTLTGPYPGTPGRAPAPQENFFSLGAKLGFTVYL